MTLKAIEGWFLVGLLGAMSILGCAGGLEYVEGTANPPEWVYRMPATKKEFCAVGVSGPTFWGSGVPRTVRMNPVSCGPVTL